MGFDDMIGLAIAGVGFLGAVGLTILAIYAAYLSGHLLLPVPFLAHLLAVTLPGLTYLSLGFPGLIQKYLRISSTTIAGFYQLLSVLDAVLLTYASTISDPDLLRCRLENHWLAWFRAKDASSVRGIQNALQCCGLWSNIDRAWPFPDQNHGADACLIDFRRDQSCGELWTDHMRFVLVAWIAIGAYGLLVKALIGILKTAPQNWSPHFLRNGTQLGSSVTGQLEYRDDPTTYSERTAALENSGRISQEETA